MTTSLWYMPWRQVFDACDRFSRQHGHRHKIESALEPGAWQVTCLVSEGSQWWHGASDADARWAALAEESPC